MGSKNAEVCAAEGGDMGVGDLGAPKDHDDEVPADVDGVASDWKMGRLLSMEIKVVGFSEDVRRCL